MRRVLHLVPDAKSEDTIKCLEYLTDEAKKGNIVGVAYAALMTERVYFTHACGAANDEWQLTRGILLELDEELRERGKTH